MPTINIKFTIGPDKVVCRIMATCHDTSNLTWRNCDFSISFSGPGFDGDKEYSFPKMKHWTSEQVDQWAMIQAYLESYSIFMDHVVDRALIEASK